MAKRHAVHYPEDNYELRGKVHKTDKYDIIEQTRVVFGHVFVIHSVVRSRTVLVVLVSVGLILASLD